MTGACASYWDLPETSPEESNQKNEQGEPLDHEKGYLPSGRAAFQFFPPCLIETETLSRRHGNY